MRTKLLLIIFLCCSPTYSETYGERKQKLESEKEGYKKVISVAKMVKKDLENTIQITPDPEGSQNFDQELCISCDDILKLTTFVNDVVNKLNQNATNLSDSYLEHSNLQALKVIAKEVNQKDKGCNQVPLVYDKFGRPIIEEHEMTLVLEAKSDINFKSIQFHSKNNKNKIVWLRGQNEDKDKLIRVFIDENGNNSIGYFRINKKTEEDNLPDISNFKHTKSMSNFELYNQTGTIDLSQRFKLSSQESSDEYLLSVGPQGSYNYYVPKDLSIINLKTETTFFENYTLSSEVDLSIKEQKGKIELYSDIEKRNLFSLDINESNYNLNIPYTKQLGQDYHLKGNLRNSQKNGSQVEAKIMENETERINLFVDTKTKSLATTIPYDQEISDNFNSKNFIKTSTSGEREVQTSLVYKEDSIVTINHSSDKNKNEVLTLSAQKNLYQGTVAIKYIKSSSNGNETAWLKYKQKF